MPHPSTSSAPYAPSHRRNTTSSKLRENRPQSTGSAPATRRRRSRSPEYPTTEDNIVRNEMRKRRPTTSFVAHSHPVVHARPVQNIPVVEEPLADRGRKGKSRHRPPSQLSEEVDMYTTEDAQNRHGNRPRRKDRSRSRETSPHLHLLKAPSPDNSEDEKEANRSYSGPLAVTEYARMKKENESLKKVSPLSWLMARSSPPNSFSPANASSRKEDGQTGKSTSIRFVCVTWRLS